MTSVTATAHLIGRGLSRQGRFWEVFWQTGQPAQTVVIDSNFFLNILFQAQLTTRRSHYVTSQKTHLHYLKAAIWKVSLLVTKIFKPEGGWLHGFSLSVSKIENGKDSLRFSHKRLFLPITHSKTKLLHCQIQQSIIVLQKSQCSKKILYQKRGEWEVKIKLNIIS